MQRTLLISEIFPPRTGGSGRWFWEVYRRQPHDRFVIAAGESLHQADFDAGHNLRIHRLPLAMRQWGLRSVSGLSGYVRSVRRLGNLARAERVSRVHCGRCLPEGIMALALRHLRGTPFVCYVHGEDVSTAADSRELRWLAGRVLRGASFVIANSRNTARILRQDWDLPTNRIAVLHPGVDTLRFVPAPPDRGVLKRLGWAGRRVVLTVGRLQKRKGHDHMIRALPQVRDRVPDVLFAVVGDGEEAGPLRRLAAREGVEASVQFLGEVDDDTLVHCYQQCDLFALPNRQVGRDIEGFGMVLLEAQACGRPVLAGASGGTAETMQIPDTGTVVGCDDPGRLGEAVAALLADRERLDRMGVAGRAWVVEHFDWAALSRRAGDLFERGAGNPRPSPLPEPACP